MVEPHSSNFRVITTNFLGVRIFMNQQPLFCKASMSATVPQPRLTKGPLGFNWVNLLLSELISWDRSHPFILECLHLNLILEVKLNFVFNTRFMYERKANFMYERKANFIIKIVRQHDYLELNRFQFLSGRNANCANHYDLQHWLRHTL